MNTVRESVRMPTLGKMFAFLFCFVINLKPNFEVLVMVVCMRLKPRMSLGERGEDIESIILERRGNPSDTQRSLWLSKKNR